MIEYVSQKLMNIYRSWDGVDFIFAILDRVILASSSEPVLSFGLVNNRSISSRLFPLVSGTPTMMKSRARPQTSPYIQNTVAAPTRVLRSRKVFVTTKVAAQLVPVVIAAQAPRDLDGSSSPIRSQGMGPNPKEKLMMYTTRATRGVTVDTPSE